MWNFKPAFTMKYLLSIHIRKWVRLLVALPVMLLVAGCVNDYDDCPAPEDGSDPVKLRFTIVTRTSTGSGTRQTRAADISGDQIGTTSENYLNIAGHDIRFLLFDGAQRLLRDFTPDANTTLAPVLGETMWLIRWKPASSNLILPMSPLQIPIFISWFWPTAVPTK